MNRRKFLKSLFFAPLLLLIDNDDIPIRWRNQFDGFDNEEIVLDSFDKIWHDYVEYTGVDNETIYEYNRDSIKKLQNECKFELRTHHNDCTFGEILYGKPDSQCEFIGLDSIIKK